MLWRGSDRLAGNPERKSPRSLKREPRVPIMIIGMKRIAIILALTLSCQLAEADDWHAALGVMDQSGMRGNDGLGEVGQLERCLKPLVYGIKAIAARLCGFPIR